MQSTPCGSLPVLQHRQHSHQQKVRRKFASTYLRVRRHCVKLRSSNACLGQNARAGVLEEGAKSKWRFSIRWVPCKLFYNLRYYRISVSSVKAYYCRTTQHVQVLLRAALGCLGDQHHNMSFIWAHLEGNSNPLLARCFVQHSCSHILLCTHTILSTPGPHASPEFIMHTCLCTAWLHLAGRVFAFYACRERKVVCRSGLQIIAVHQAEAPLAFRKHITSCLHLTVLQMAMCLKPTL